MPKAKSNFLQLPQPLLSLVLKSMSQGVEVKTFHYKMGQHFKALCLRLLHVHFMDTDSTYTH